MAMFSWLCVPTHIPCQEFMSCMSLMLFVLRVKQRGFITPSNKGKTKYEYKMQYK